ncbi:acetyl-CoA carboxylase biotin carboxyl carrier protein [Ferrovibrio terrae]|uniref:Biotin carboxyl carrier protein of acetyl-CoA carboxylase n=1 Tax=Ferrovibrio terrae TaxID=2594003 RepID=A0A516H6B4_9PROT|nr:acetyl-CoA carboxylase biotin carboxyl carrier protein [Ferrovibrio terrae]QDO99255.1 acetyl-CoA carboxylase biotin carboxyl carrier protein [Ferrovibrio terrae]
MAAPKDKKADSRIDQQMIRELADLLNETGLTEIEWSEGPLKVRVTKGGTPIYAAAPMAAAAAAAAVAATGGAPAASDDASHPGALKSPMVGTVYTAAEPGAAPFVKVGDSVTAGQTVLIVEAMKTMNPITAPKGGRIARILIENQQPVEFGQPLLIIE